jgi:hypothetical protein
MINNHNAVPDTVTRLHEIRLQIDDLLPKLDEANQACVNATKPLDRLAELDLHQRQQLAERIRAAYKERDSITELIHEALARLESVGSA